MYEQTTIDPWGVTIGLYGDAGVGKTTAFLGLPGVSLGMPNPFVLSCEQGTDFFEGLRVRHISSPQSLIDAVDYLKTQTQPHPKNGRPAFKKSCAYQSVLLDGLGRLYQDSRLLAAKGGYIPAGFDVTDAKNPARKEPRAAHYFAIEGIIPALLWLKELYAPVAVTLHATTTEREVLEPLTGQKKKIGGWALKRRETEPDLSPRFRQLFVNTLDVLAFAYREPTTGDRLFIAEQLYSETRLIVAKDRTGVIGTIANPDYGRRGRQGPNGYPTDVTRVIAPRELCWQSFSGPLLDAYDASRQALLPPPAAPELPDGVTVLPSDLLPQASITKEEHRENA